MVSLSYSDYERFRELLKERVGLYFDEKKQKDLIRHVQATMEACDMTDVATFYHQLRNTPVEDALWRDLISRLTVGETYFFRDAAQMLALREHILPELIHKRRKAGHFILRLWSAGCASGEEAYTLAIMLRELIPDIHKWSVMILGTDINRESLEKASRGLFTARSFRNDTPDYIQSRYFQAEDKLFRLKPEIHNRVTFNYLNLVEDNYPSSATFTIGLDLIICRNVTIYFDRDTTQDIIGRFHRALLPDSWLVVGHSEPLASIYEGFKPRNFKGAIIYKKIRLEEVPASIPVPPPPPEPRPVAHPAPPVTPKPVPVRQPDPEPAEESSSQKSYAIQCYEKGKVYANQMQWTTALEWLERALEHDPLFVEAHFTRAFVYLNEGNDQAALEAFRRVLYLDRNAIMAHFNMGLIHQRLGNLKGAQRAWKITGDLLAQLSPEEELAYSEGMSAGYLTSLLKTYLDQIK